MRPQAAQVGVKLIVTERSFVRIRLSVVHVVPKRKRTAVQDKLVQEKGERNAIPFIEPASHRHIQVDTESINGIIRKSGMRSFMIR